MVTSLCSLSTILSTVPLHFKGKPYRSRSITFFKLWGLSNLLRYPMSVRVLTQLVSCIENCSSAIPSSALIWGPSTRRFTWAAAILYPCPYLSFNSLLAFDVPFLFTHGEAAIHEFLYRARSVLDKVTQARAGTEGFSFHEMLEGTHKVTIIDWISTEDLHIRLGSVRDITLKGMVLTILSFHQELQRVVFSNSWSPMAPFRCFGDYGVLWISLQRLRGRLDGLVPGCFWVWEIDCIPFWRLRGIFRLLEQLIWLTKRFVFTSAKT